MKSLPRFFSKRSLHFLAASLWKPSGASAISRLMPFFPTGLVSITDQPSVDVSRGRHARRAQPTFRRALEIRSKEVRGNRHGTKPTCPSASIRIQLP